MPTYQYICTNPECGTEFERVQSFTDPAVSECPVCGGAVRKQYGSVGVVFKGSGFYRTDSRADAKSSTTAKKEPSKSSDSGSGSSAGSNGSSGASSSSTSSGSAGSSSTSSPAKATA